MVLPKINMILWLAFLLVYCAYNPVWAQVIPVSPGGKIFNIGVTPQPGSTYFWKIFSDYTFTKEASTADAQFIQGNQGASVYIELKKRGTFFYTVTAFGPSGCSNLKAGYLENISPIIAIAGADKIICQTAVLDASRSTGDISAYKWDMIDPYGNLSSPDQKSTVFTISSSYGSSYPAIFRVMLTVRDQLGNTDIDTLKITFDQPAVADVRGSGKLEKDGSMVVDGSLSKGTALQYQWSTMEGKITGDSRNPVVVLNGAGTYKLQVIDSHGCKDEKSFLFPLPTTSIIATNDVARTTWDKPVIIPVLNNDFDADHDIKLDFVSIKDKPSRGQVFINTDKTVTYKNNLNEAGNDQFTYTVCDSVGNCGTAKVNIRIEGAGVLPTEAFSPNGDNLNDLLVFKGLVENYPESQIYIYTRAGQLVYSSLNYQNDWDGKMKGSNQLVTMGTYYYILKLGGTDKIVKGFVFINY